MTKVEQIELIAATSVTLSTDGMRVNIEYGDHTGRPGSLDCSKRDFESFLYIEGELKMVDQQHQITAERWFEVYGSLDRNAAASKYLQRKAMLVLTDDSFWPMHPIKAMDPDQFEMLEIRNRQSGIGYSFVEQNY